LRFFFLLLLGEAAAFFLTGVFLAEVGFEAVLFDAALRVGALAAGAGASPVSTDGWDWATAGGKKPSQSREKNPANTTTAIRRTQILLTAENWHP
jgi:hypothetical protein